MTERGARTRHVIGVLAIAMATLTVASLPAKAQVGDAFAQFQARCLVPMAEVRESVTLGLDLVAADARSETWMVPSRDWELVRSTPSARVHFCAIHGAFGAEVNAWTDTVVEAGDYIRVGSAPETLQSTIWREPRIEVEIDRAAQSLTVKETNLES